tara:strand:+ start:59 stop:343 length:285 start_codon:yes stop_codon:yes gene_type:complete
MKGFFIKLISITIAVILVINVVFNLFFAEQIKGINQFLSISKTETRKNLRNKLREEAKGALQQENLLNEEDKIILLKLYNKIKKEFETVDLSDK